MHRYDYANMERGWSIEDIDHEFEDFFASRGDVSNFTAEDWIALEQEYELTVAMYEKGLESGKINTSEYSDEKAAMAEAASGGSDAGKMPQLADENVLYPNCKGCESTGPLPPSNDDEPKSGVDSSVEGEAS